MMDGPFVDLAHATVLRTDIPRLLRERPAVILERLAMGGGATNWYYCANFNQLPDVTSRFRPGSLVSFYFDGRIQRQAYSSDLLPRLENMLDESPAIQSGVREIVFGVLQADGTSIAVGFPSSMEEIEEEVSDAQLASVVFFGFFPGRDDDGKSAVTLVLPDADGIVRAHPY
jgi:hypothetical protein